MMNQNSYLIEIFSESETPILFIDFDGTISKFDVIDQILGKFADDRWLEIEEKWVKGEIGSRQCLHEQFLLVRASPRELNDYLDTLEIDEGFLTLLRFCRDADIEVNIVSDGFEYYIRRMLEKFVPFNHLSNLKIWANNLLPSGENEWKTEFPHFAEVCSDGCATCKPTVMIRQNPYQAPSIFIGDGLSDCFAAKTADVVFAKSKLSEFCLKNQIPQTSYHDLKQVAESLDQAFEFYAWSSLGGRQMWLQTA